MIGMGYQQINTNHTVFSLQNGGHITMLTVYVDDMIINGEDEGWITRLKTRLEKKFEVKDWDNLCTFLGLRRLVEQRLLFCLRESMSKIV
jgi:Reverse transcriptase (RNA-dependent DNA polymerase)